jgi:hypothetical protein
VIRFYYSCAHEQFAPGDLLRHAAAAEGVPISWAPSDDEPLDPTRIWKGAGPPELYVESWPDPRAIYEHTEETRPTTPSARCGSCPPVTSSASARSSSSARFVLMNISGADPRGAVDVYAELVPPALHGRVE